jgi:hypothetical protein
MMITQRVIVKPKAIQQQHLTLNVPSVDQLFSGFTTGDFAVLYGSQSMVSFTSRLCVRAQLPSKLGGLDSNVVFIDGGATFGLHKITRQAQLHQINPQEALDKIINYSASTAYQLTKLLMKKLEETIKKSDAKLVIISDITNLFLDENITDEEAEKVYSQILNYLSSFAKTHQVIIVATYLPHHKTSRSEKLQEISLAKANIVFAFSKTLYTSDIALEKHPSFMLGVADWPSENLTLTDFMGNGKFC